MRYYILSLNGECRIIKGSLRAPLSEINYAAFGVPYGVKFHGTERNIALALRTGLEAGFKEAIMDGKKISLEPVGLAGVV